MGESTKISVKTIIALGMLVLAINSTWYTMSIVPINERFEQHEVQGDREHHEFDLEIKDTNNRVRSLEIHQASDTVKLDNLNDTLEELNVLLRMMYTASKEEKNEYIAINDR